MLLTELNHVPPILYSFSLRRSLVLFIRCNHPLYMTDLVISFHTQQIFEVLCKSIRIHTLHVTLYLRHWFKDNNESKWVSKVFWTISKHHSPVMTCSHEVHNVCRWVLSMALCRDIIYQIMIHIHFYNAISLWNVYVTLIFCGRYARRIEKNYRERQVNQFCGVYVNTLLALLPLKYVLDMLWVVSWGESRIATVRP